MFLLYPSYYNAFSFFFKFSFILLCPNGLIPHPTAPSHWPFLPSHCSISCSIGDTSQDDFIFPFSVFFLDTFNQYLAARIQETAYNGRNNVIKYCQNSVQRSFVHETQSHVLLFSPGQCPESHSYHIRAGRVIKACCDLIV